MLITVPNIKYQHSENKQNKNGKMVGFRLEIETDKTGISLKVI